MTSFVSHPRKHRLRRAASAFLLLALFAIALVASGPASSENLLVHPDFEAPFVWVSQAPHAVGGLSPGSLGWSNSTNPVSFGPAQEGGQRGQVQDIFLSGLPGSYGDGLVQHVQGRLVPGRTYVARAEVRVFQGSVELGVGPLFQGDAAKARSTGTGEWQPLITYYTVPDGDTSATFRIYGIEPGTHFYVNNIYLGSIGDVVAPDVEFTPLCSDGCFLCDLGPEPEFLPLCDDDCWGCIPTDVPSEPPTPPTDEKEAAFYLGYAEGVAHSAQNDFVIFGRILGADEYACRIVDETIALLEQILERVRALPGEGMSRDEAISVIEALIEELRGLSIPCGNMGGG